MLSVDIRTTFSRVKHCNVYSVLRTLLVNSEKIVSSSLTADDSKEAFLCMYTHMYLFVPDLALYLEMKYYAFLYTSG